MDELDHLRLQISNCDICSKSDPPLPHAPNPVLQVKSSAKVLIAGQAPGNLADQTCKPFNDPSGKRLREWLGVSDAEFYDPDTFAIVPMGFCFPGYARSGGDLPPRKECALTWREHLITKLAGVKVQILIGGYAQSWHLGKSYRGSVTETVENWRQFAPDYFPVPHPSWRNNSWLKKYPWFEKDLLPELQTAVRRALSG